MNIYNTEKLRSFIIDTAKAYEDQSYRLRAKVAWDILDRMDDLIDSEHDDEERMGFMNEENMDRMQLASFAEREPWAKIDAAVPLVVDQEIKPPGHTCPAIDATQSALRKVKWRINNKPDASEINELLLAASKLLEVVREENRQMRAAHADMQRRLTCKST